METHSANVTEAGNARDESTETVSRGPKSWALIYAVLGIAISVEGTVIQLWPPSFPLGAPAPKFFIFVVVAIVTSILFVECGRFHDYLFRVIQQEQGRAR